MSEVVCTGCNGQRLRQEARMVKIVVSGEALMDVFAAGDTPTGMALDARIGGSPFNVAVGLCRLSQPAAFFGAVSKGFLGERLMQALQACVGEQAGASGAKSHPVSAKSWCRSTAWPARRSS